MIEQEERIGDFGSAVGGMTDSNEISQSPFTGGYDLIQRSRLNEPNNRIPIIMGAIMIVGLIFLCFRLAYDGIRDSKPAQRIAGRAYLDDGQGGTPDTPYRGAAAPINNSNLPPTIPVQPNITRTNSAAFFTPATMTGTIPQPKLFDSPAAQMEAIALLSDCRVAFNLSGDLSRKWYETISRVAANNKIKPTNSLNPSERSLSSDDTATTTPDAPQEVITAPQYVSADDWNTIDTQMEAISGTIFLAAQPFALPLPLQETSSEMGREMHEYLQTTRTALITDNLSEREKLHGRADTHRARAGQLLSQLESAVKSGSLPAGIVNN